MTQLISHDKDAVLDLETVGVNPGCVVLSIGATTLAGDEFYVAIQPASCIAAGLVINNDTLEWWNSLDNNLAFDAAWLGTTSLKDALYSFSNYYKDLGVTAIWGNGAGFDMPILAAAYRAVGIPVPWAHTEERCYRTLRALYPHIAATDFAGIKHHALHDAKYEAAHLRKILEAI